MISNKTLEIEIVYIHQCASVDAVYDINDEI